MITSRLIYFCSHNKPTEWEIYWWFEVFKKARAFCPFLKEWENCFCVIETDDKLYKQLEEHPNPYRKKEWNNMIDFWKKKYWKEKIKFKKYKIDKWYNLDEILSYKYTVNLWKIKKIVVNYYKNVDIRFIDNDWVENILFLPNRDKELVPYAEQFLTFLLSCNELWNIGIRFGEKVIAEWPRSWYTYLNINDCKINQSEIHSKCDPRNGLFLLNNWKEVKAKDRKFLEKMYIENLWTRAIEIPEKHKGHFEALLEIAKSKKNLEISYPQAWMYID